MVFSMNILDKVFTTLKRGYSEEAKQGEKRWKDVQRAQCKAADSRRGSPPRRVEKQKMDWVL
jgi:hypothetical protein